MANETEITIEAYNKTALQYAQNVANLQKTAYLTQFVSLLPAKARILDMGCGSGRDAKIFSDRGFKVTGIDLSEKMINISRKNCP